MNFYFENYTINGQEYCLRCNDREVSIEPKVFDVILYLIENADRVVSRDEFFSKVWASVEVSDATLSNHINIARAALGDDGQSQRVIKTVRGRGYQFILPFERDAQQENLAALQVNSIDVIGKVQSLQRKPIFLAVLCTGLLSIFALAYYATHQREVNLDGSTSIEQKEAASTAAHFEESLNSKLSIAVLPFTKLSKNADHDYFVDGIHADLLTQISKLQQFKTISRSAVVNYKNHTQSLDEIGSSLGVDAMLEGSVQRVGENIRVHAQLYDTRSQSQLWAETYAKKLTAENIFIIQNEIAVAIAKQLGGVLTVSDALSLEQAPTNNLKALEAYFQAGAFIGLGTTQGFIESRRLLQRAIDEDPNFTEAYAYLAIANLDLIHWAGLASGPQIKKAEELIQRALELDPNSSATFTALAELKQKTGEFLESEKAFKKAIELNVNDSDVLEAYGRLLLWDLRRPYEAVDLMQQAVELKPQDKGTVINLIHALISAGRFDQALALANELISSNPSYGEAYRAKADVYYWKGHHLAQSQLNLSKRVELEPESPFNTMLMSTVYYMIGDTEMAKRWLMRADRLAPESNNARFAKALISYYEGGDRAEAFELFLTGKTDTNVFPVSIYDVVSEAITLDRIQELEHFYRARYEELFASDAKVNTSNFISALAIARIMKASERGAQAKNLMRQCLEVVQFAPYGGWNTRESDWKTRIYLGLEQFDLALLAFQEYVASGQGSLTMINNPIYEPIRHEPLFQRSLTQMKTRLAEEKSRIRAMEGDGSIILPSALRQ